VPAGISRPVGRGHHLRSAACQFVVTVIDPHMSSVRTGT
jgi:hypothetical protein